MRRFKRRRDNREGLQEVHVLHVGDDGDVLQVAHVLHVGDDEDDLQVAHVLHVGDDEEGALLPFALKARGSPTSIFT